MKRFNRRDFIKVGSSSFAILALTGCTADNQVAAIEIEQNAPKVDIVECDFLIRRGIIYDGNNNPPFVGDIAIKGDEIIRIDEKIETKGARIIDAREKIVAPGFIDIHTHTENYIANGGAATMILLQGVTTQIGGNCGATDMEVGPILDRLGDRAINFGMFSGYRELRRMVVGNRNIRPTWQQTTKIFGVLEKNIKDGAYGLSVALEYWPQSYASTEEIVELANLVAYYDGILAMHLRSEGDRIEEALEEALNIAGRVNVPLQYSHIKAAHPNNWHKMDNILKTLEDAKKSGIDVMGDAYGYDFSSNDLQTEYYSMSAENVEKVLNHPQTIIGSDSGLSNYGVAVHPRAYGNYPRIIGKYVRDEEIMPLETAIHKMTAMPADRLSLKDRGRIEIGSKADIVVFDFNIINDLATRQNPNIYSKGVENVLVNGKLAIRNGTPTGIAAGKVLRNNGVS